MDYPYVLRLIVQQQYREDAAFPVDIVESYWGKQLELPFVPILGMRIAIGAEDYLLSPHNIIYNYNTKEFELRSVIDRPEGYFENNGFYKMKT